jgi:hypothetical protein
LIVIIILLVLMFVLRLFVILFSKLVDHLFSG